MRKLTHIRLDMDGVLTDFHSAVATLFGLPTPAVWAPGQHLEDYINCSPAAMWRQIDSAGREFWAEMPAYAYADHVVTTMLDYAAATRARLIITTSPSRRPAAVVGKAQWLAWHYPELLVNSHFTDDKAADAAHPAALLLDDRPIITDPFVGDPHSGGMAVVFPQPWNDWGRAFDPNVFNLAAMLDAARRHPLRYIRSAADIAALL